MTTPSPPSSPAPLAPVHADPVTFPEQREGFYMKLRRRITRWAERQSSPTCHATYALLALPDLFRLLCCLTIDPEVAAKQKARIVLALLYLVAPIDFLPEAIFGVAGYLDDLVVITFVLNQFLNVTDERVVLRHWKGDGDVIRMIRHFVEVSDELVGSGLLRRIRRFLEG